MKKIEELFNIDLGRKFDTPKKLNRSTSQVRSEIVNQLEEGNFTSEMIAELRKDYPIFYYRTCITIHGTWPEVERTRIGAYKNVIQNKNGSLEIRWSAIDNGKVHEIANGLRGTGSPWHYSENSNGRSFIIQKVITKETFQAVRAELEPIARELSEFPIYGYLNLYTAATPWGVTYLVLSLSPLAVPVNQVKPLTLKLSNLDPEKYAEVRANYLREEEEENQRREIAWAEMQAQARAKKAAWQKETAEKYAPQIASLTPCEDITKGMLVSLDTFPDAGFVFYRYDGAGAFGRMKWSRAIGKELKEPTDWKEMKQATRQEMRLVKNTRLFVPAAKGPIHTPNLKKLTTPATGKVLATI